MKKIIVEKLKEIEEQFCVKVLFAVESGSRAWGFPSKDSDYDVRFVYIHQPDWYLAIDPQGVGEKRDVIEMPINELLDISGWEITKALRLFRKSNPPLLEWMRSDIIYYQAYSFMEELKVLEKEAFFPNASLYHYLNMAKNNYRTHLLGPKVKIKKYFYALRPVLAGKWIRKFGTVPPINFHELLYAMVPAGPLNDEIGRLLARKIAGEEMDLEPRINLLHQFLESEMDLLETYAKTLPLQKTDSTEKLDTLFRNKLKEVWDFASLEKDSSTL